jgi:hypothetical protein
MPSGVEIRFGHILVPQMHSVGPSFLALLGSTLWCQQINVALRDSGE